MADNTITPGVEIEPEPVVCGRCKRTFASLMIEEIRGIRQLRAGNMLIREIEASCMHCGFKFHWHIPENDVQKMAVTYGEVLNILKNGYMPE